MRPWAACPLGPLGSARFPAEAASGMAGVLAGCAVTDGDADNTGFEVGNAGAGTSFVFDLGTPRAISALRFRTGSNGFSNSERPVDLAYSDNGTDWTSNPGPNLPTFSVNQDIDLVFGDVGAHRYWRLLWTGGASTRFGEIEGYADRTGAIPLAELAAEAARADAAIASEVARANAAYDAAGAATAAQNASSAYTVSVIPRTWQGEWQNGPLYTTGDVVSSNGSLFVCLGDSQGQLPNDSVTPNGPWQLLAGMKGYVESASSNNTNAVVTLDVPFSNDPPTLADLEVLRAKQNEVILALLRS